MHLHSTPSRVTSGPAAIFVRFGLGSVALVLVATVLSCAARPEAAPSHPRAVGSAEDLVPIWQSWGPGIDYARLGIDSLDGAVVAHLVRVDLARAPVTVLSSRSAEGQVMLKDPKQLLRHSGAIVAVNASPYATETLRAGALATISGLSLESGNLVSEPSQRLWSFYLTTDGSFSLLPPGGVLPEDAIQGAGGFFPLVTDSAPRGREGRRDARTAIGLHRDGSLYVAVVDGRRWGHSRGATTRELGRWLADLGVEDALNLDGGGSSILLARRRDTGRNRVRTVNRPLGGLLYGGRRPVANVLLMGEGDFD